MNGREIVARLIYGFYVGNPNDGEFPIFCAALDLYAHTAEEERPAPADPLPTDPLPITAPTVQLEVPESGMITAKYTFDGTEPFEGDKDRVFRISAEEIEESNAQMEKMRSEADAAAAAIIGRGSAEKREIYERLLAFLTLRGAGTKRRLAEAGNGALTLEDVLDMAEARPTPLAKWRIVNKAMDWIEAQEAESKD